MVGLGETAMRLYLLRMHRRCPWLRDDCEWEGKEEKIKGTLMEKLKFSVRATLNIMRYVTLVQVFTSPSGVSDTWWLSAEQCCISVEHLYTSKRWCPSLHRDQSLACCERIDCPRKIPKTLSITPCSRLHSVKIFFYKHGFSRFVYLVSATWFVQISSPSHDKKLVIFSMSPRSVLLSNFRYALDTGASYSLSTAYIVSAWSRGSIPRDILPATILLPCLEGIKRQQLRISPNVIKTTAKIDPKVGKEGLLNQLLGPCFCVWLDCFHDVFESRMPQLV